MSGERNREIQADSLDLFGLSRFLRRRGDSGRAHAACAQALDLGLPAEFRPRARRELAQLAKRRGDHEGAALLWRELAAEATDSPEDSIHACEQMAVYYERRLRDYVQAVEFAQLALAKLHRHGAGSRDSSPARGARLEKSLLNRIARLRQRISFTESARTSLPLTSHPRRVA